MVDSQDTKNLDEFLPIDEAVMSTEGSTPVDGPASEPQAFGSNRFLLGLVIAGVVVLSFFLWSGARTGFPKLAPGSYLGAITVPNSKGSQPSLKLYVERAPSDDDLLFIVVSDGWLPQKITPASQDGTQALFPITISGKDGSFRLEGRQVSENQYGGKVVLIDSGKIGEWTLRPLSQGQNQMSQTDSDEMRSWLTLQAGVTDAAAHLASLREALDKQKDEIDTLTGYVTEGGDLKARAAKKLEGIKHQQDDARLILERKQKEAKELEDKIEIAESVTRMGRLVSLSRETLEREARWADSILRTAGDYSIESNSGASEADQEAKLKQSIELERERISRLEQLIGNNVNSDSR